MVYTVSHFPWLSSWHIKDWEDMQLSEIEILKESLDVSWIFMRLAIILAVISVVFYAVTLAFQRSHNRRSEEPY
jgi:hypothetical protein